MNTIPTAAETGVEASQIPEQIQFSPELLGFLAAVEQSYAQTNPAKAAEIHQAAEGLATPNEYPAALGEVYLYMAGWRSQLERAQTKTPEVPQNAPSY